MRVALFVDVTVHRQRVCEGSLLWLLLGDLILFVEDGELGVSAVAHILILIDLVLVEALKKLSEAIILFRQVLEELMVLLTIAHSENNENGGNQNGI